MKLWKIFILLILFTSHLYAQRVVRIITCHTSPNAKSCHKLVDEPFFYAEGWDTIPEVVFWSKVMFMEPNKYALYSTEPRLFLGEVSGGYWDKLSSTKQKYIKDSLRKKFDLNPKEVIQVTHGRKHFYKFSKIIPKIGKAIDIFVRNGCDPWYAQAILLIESPASGEATSIAGAGGHFQLMPEVATEMGLIVNDSIDQRTDFVKSCWAASSLIKRNCLPQARSMMNRRGIAFHETDTWFRLLVMHIYHAGGGNVEAALNKIKPKAGGTELIQKLWATEAADFGNESQNYSQIAMGAVYCVMQIIETQNKVCSTKEVKF